MFDFGAIKSLIQRKDFTFVYDSMNGVQVIIYIAPSALSAVGAPLSVLLPAHCGAN